MEIFLLPNMLQVNNSFVAEDKQEIALNKNIQQQ